MNASRTAPTSQIARTSALDNPHALVCVFRVSQRPPPENPFVNIGVNVVAPIIALTWLSKADRLGPLWGLVLAVSIPLAYGVYDLVRRRQWNALSLIGIASVLLTGGLGLLRLDPFWFAVKEAAVPLALGIAVVVSQATRFPLVKLLLYNPAVLDTERIEAALEARGARGLLDPAMARASWLVAGSFALSAVLNFILARWIVVSEPGSEAFNAELGRLTALSFPVIALPSMVVLVVALFGLLARLRAITGLTTDELLRSPPKKP